ncbi:MAG: hypothetical protein IBX63_11550, partial [Coriobacteriia bacterium]|nr:hypothetical protein [Coriobacteriia bacterium]
MGFRDLDILDAYDTDAGSPNPVDHFYIPCLETAVRYDRLAGFFSSGSLAVAARGIAGMVASDGRMRIVCSPYLPSRDKALLEEVTAALLDPSAMQELLGDVLLRSLEPAEIETELVRDHVQALGWMLREGLLEIKICIPKDESGRAMSAEEIEREGLFHMKVGILIDEVGDALSFSGSINESRAAWEKHIEEFKVFFGWEEPCRVAQDTEKFLRYWRDRSSRMRTVDLPDAVKLRLLEVAPEDRDELGLVKKRKREVAPLEPPATVFELWDHQADAVE